MSDAIFESLWDLAQGREGAVARRLAQLAYQHVKEQVKGQVAAAAKRANVVEGEFREVGELDIDQSARRAKAQKLIAEIDKAETFLITILGRPGTGKTALACKIADRRRKEIGRKVYALGIDQRAIDTARIGEWMRPAGDLGDLPDNVDVLIDDASLAVGSQDYRSDAAKHFLELVELRRHRGIGMILNCQEGSAVNHYAFSADVVFLKPSGSFFPEMDRPALRPFLMKADEAFRKLDPDQVKFHVMAMSRWPFPTFEDLLSYTYPDWYSEEFSRNKARMS